MSSSTPYWPSDWRALAAMVANITPGRSLASSRYFKRSLFFSSRPDDEEGVRRRRGLEEEEEEDPPLRAFLFLWGESLRPRRFFPLLLFALNLEQDVTDLIGIGDLGLHEL